MNYSILPTSFYVSNDVLFIAKELLGKLLVTEINGIITSGRIVETEAYLGVTDRASHAFGGKRTARTGTMYKSGGIAYIYLCYGIHHLINVVTGPEDIPHAVLIRAIEPVEGKECMIQRTGRKKWDGRIGSGPGNVTKALGISHIQNGVSFDKGALQIASDGFSYSADRIIATPRIGIDYAGDDVLKPYRFAVKAHPQVSAAAQTKKWIESI